MYYSKQALRRGCPHLHIYTLTFPVAELLRGTYQYRFYVEFTEPLLFNINEFIVGAFNVLKYSRMWRRKILMAMEASTVPASRHIICSVIIKVISHGQESISQASWEIALPSVPCGLLFGKKKNPQN